jgi:hypothetical protein
MSCSEDNVQPEESLESLEDTKEHMVRSLEALENLPMYSRQFVLVASSLALFFCSHIPGNMKTVRLCS